MAQPRVLYVEPSRDGSRLANWRAGCGKSASPVRWEGWRKPMRHPYPYTNWHTHTLLWPAETSVKEKERYWPATITRERICKYN